MVLRLFLDWFWSRMLIKRYKKTALENKYIFIKIPYWKQNKSILQKRRFLNFLYSFSFSILIYMYFINHIRPTTVMNYWPFIYLDPQRIVDLTYCDEWMGHWCTATFVLSRMSIPICYSSQSTSDLLHCQLSNFPSFILFLTLMFLRVVYILV